MWIEITWRKYAREAQRYASDLTDAEWALFEPHMPAVKRPGRPRGNFTTRATSKPPPGKGFRGVDRER